MHLATFRFYRSISSKSKIDNIGSVAHVLFKGKKQLVRNAIDLTAKSLVSAVEYNQSSRLHLPELLREDIICD